MQSRPGDCRQTPRNHACPLISAIHNNQDTGYASISCPHRHHALTPTPDTIEIQYIQLLQDQPQPSAHFKHCHVVTQAGRVLIASHATRTRRKQCPHGPSRSSSTTWRATPSSHLGGKHPRHENHSSQAKDCLNSRTTAHAQVLRRGVTWATGDVVRGSHLLQILSSWDVSHYSQGARTP